MDDDDQRRNGGESIGRREARSQHMRDLLASQGIALDEKREPSRRYQPPPPVASEPVDRGEVARILLAGVQEGLVDARHVDWMAETAPSVAAAHEHITIMRAARTAEATKGTP